ncbi:MAG: hypothetical protein GY845_12235 [Planctomycetes bacterium]|nr:hypothetical protein [Planctomycetota bacterium]
MRYEIPNNQYATRCTLSAVIPSTTVENIRQIPPYLKKQTQFYAIFTPKRRFNEKTNPIQTQFKPKQSQNKANIKTVLRDKSLQAQSAKMARKLTSSNHQNDTREKYNFLSINMLNGLIQYNPPTGTSFAYLSPRR